MRYLGSPTMGQSPPGSAIPLPPQLGTGQPLDPLVKAQLLALAPGVPDAQASDLLDFVDATHLGKQQKFMRIGIGAAGGLVLGFALCKILGGKRR